jgi:hypothetical protein
MIAGSRFSFANNEYTRQSKGTITGFDEDYCSGDTGTWE